MDQHFKITKLIFVPFIILFIYHLFTNPFIYFEITFNTLNLWFRKVYPSIFIFYIFANLINYIDFNFRINTLTQFNTKQANKIFIISFLIGNPSTSVLTTENLKNNLITIEDSEKLFCLSSFLNPFFLYTFLTSLEIPFESIIILLISHYMSNIILLILYNSNRNNYNKNINNTNINSKMNIFKLIENINTILLKVASIMVICNIIYHEMLIILNLIKIPHKLSTICLSLIEVTSGLSHLASLNIGFNMVLTLMSFLISFSSISIILQVYSIINETNFKKQKFFIARIYQGLLSSVITFLLIQFNYIMILIIIIIVIIIKKTNLFKKICLNN